MSPSPALQPVPQRHTTPSRRPFSLAPGRSRGRSVATQLPPLHHSAAALPARRSDAGPAETALAAPAPRRPRRTHASGMRARRATRPGESPRPPAHGTGTGPTGWRRGGEAGSKTQTRPSSELAAPALLTDQERERQQQPVEHRAEHVRLHAPGDRGVGQGSLGRRGAKGRRGASGFGAPWCTRRGRS